MGSEMCIRDSIQAAYVAAVFDRSQATQALMDRTNRLKQLQTTMVPLVDAQVADVRRLAQLGDLEVPLVLQVLESAWQTKRAVVLLQAEQTKAENRLFALNLPAWLFNDVSVTGVAP